MHFGNFPLFFLYLSRKLGAISHTHCENNKINLSAKVSPAASYD